MAKTKKSLVKKFIVAFSILLGVFLLLIGAFSIYIATHKEKIIGLIEKAVKENLNGQVSIKSIDVSLWSSFPKAEIDLNNVLIADSAYHKPFLQLAQISATIGLFDILGKETHINNVKLSNGFIHFFTDTTGYTNTYLLSTKKKAANTKGKKLAIKNIILDHVNLISENQQKDKRFEVDFEKMNAAINEQSDSVWHIKMREKCLVKGLAFDLAKGSYINNQTVAGSWDIHLNTKNVSFSFDKTTLTFNGQSFTIDGAFFLKDSAHFSLNVSTDQLHYDQVSELLPNNITRVLKLFKLSQPLDVQASIQGPMAAGTTPLVNVNWSVNGTDLKTDIVSLTNCSFSGIFTNQIQKNLPVCDENSEVLFTRFTSYLGAIKLTGKNILVTNMINSQLKFDLSSECDFAQLDTTLALNSVRFVSGHAQLRLLYDGPLVDDMTLLNKLNLNLNLHNGIIQYTPRNLTFNNFNGDVLFADNTLKGGNIHCDFKQNHFDVNITGNDISKLSDSIAGKANIYCSIFTPLCNLSDFSSLFSSKSEVVTRKQSSQSITGTKSEIDDLLENGNLFVSIQANKLFLGKFEATNANAKLIFRQTDWQITSASLKQSGGTLNISAKVSNTNPAFHTATATLNIQNADIQKVFNAFDNFGQQGLTYQNLRGVVNTTATVNCNLDNKGAIINNSIGGNLFFSIKNGALLNYKPLEQIKVSFLKNRNLDDIEFAELHDSLNIHAKDIYFHRMEIASSALDFFVEGIFSLDNNTDISIQVPFSNLNKQPDGYKPTNKGTDAKAGASLYFRARPDKAGQIKIKLDLFRKLRGDYYSKMKDN